MSVTEYLRELVRLSQYARECVSTEVVICKRFKDGLNKDICLLVRILEIKEYVVLVERACKAEDLGKEKRKADFEAREVRKRSTGKSFQSGSKKFRDDSSHSKASAGHLNRDRVRSQSNYKSSATFVASIDNAKNERLECDQCEIRHFGECWRKSNNRACYSCGLEIIL